MLQSHRILYYVSIKSMVADSRSIVARWRNYFSQLFNVHGVKDVGQVEIPTADPLVPEPSAFEVELAIDKLKNHKTPGIDEIPAELIKAGGGTICLEIHKLISKGENTVKWIKGLRISWLGHLARMEDRMPKKIFT